ncbi:hypothetical protein FOG18_13835 (plasmid) [Legionella israelensis]|uniref:hypothetical protein n=1 Tax=Legionella israelensis TaxID=454 RepID=UPI00117E2A5E|nr:hypothetical protein [Legionella israelensis]QDP73734.1 hypothetical protein FOG18_13835 [Legionella israelensis]
MEMILDMGRDIVHSLEEIAAKEGKKTDIVALEMIAMGIRLYKASKEKSEEINDIDMVRNILKTSLANQELLGEILSIIFNKERSRLGAYDAETAIKMADKLSEKYILGGERL